MPWVLNDEEAPWYNAIEKGFYSDVCLDVELVGGGPGKNHVMTLAGGAVDIAVSAAGSRVFSLSYSKTPAKVVAIGAFLKHMPYVWLGLDHDIPKNQRSNKKLKPRDFIGKRIGIQGGDDYLFDYMANKHNIPKDKVEIMAGGFTPDPVLVGSMDYIGAWIVNQPRLLEEKGYMNWVAFPFSDWGLDGYSDVSVARQETVDNNPDMLKRYLAATHQGLKFLLENPDESAEIAVKYGVDAQLTKKQALRRFELQEALVSDGPNEILMEMKAERWNDTLANFIEYKQIELKNCK
jgi:ABC-type nitrate/sulfonate/bicarbonate transport system substrate-binding protein